MTLEIDTSKPNIVDDTKTTSNTELGNKVTLFNDDVHTFDEVTNQIKTHPTKGFAVRPGWHICREPVAPHLSMRGRVWCKVRFDGKIRSHIRPKAQGGLWYTSTYLTIIKENT